MARIDQFVDALYQRGADRVVLATGEKAALVFGDKVRPVTASVLHAKLVTSFPREIVPPELSQEVGQDGEHHFAYESPSGAVTVGVHRGAGSVRVELTPSDPPAVERVAEPAPASTPVALPVAPVGAGERLDSVPSSAATAEMDALFRAMCAEGCSDLHLCSGCPPLVRKDGAMVPLGSGEPLDAGRAREQLYSITPAIRFEEFEERNDVDFSYELPGVGRFRCNLFRDRKGVGGVFRIIPSECPTAEQIGLSSHVLDLCHLKKGLVVVTGPTGSGKSTTLAAMVDYINRNRSAHIITIEDPIEFVHDNKKCLINQREIDNHTTSYKAALRAALREDPDIVLVGEMRDLETVEIAIETAETGHLVFGTLHTNTAASTVDRIIDQFPADRQAQVRTMLASSLKGVIAQILCRKREGGRTAVLEVLIVTHAVSNLIREGKTFQIGSLVQTGKNLGMVTLNDALLDLVVRKVIEPEEACSHAVSRSEFVKLLAGQGIEQTG